MRDLELLTSRNSSRCALRVALDARIDMLSAGCHCLRLYLPLILLSRLTSQTRIRKSMRTPGDWPLLQLHMYGVSGQCSRDHAGPSHAHVQHLQGIGRACSATQRCLHNRWTTALGFPPVVLSPKVHHLWVLNFKPQTSTRDCTLECSHAEECELAMTSGTSYR